MKILSQLMNAVPDANGKLNVADAGKGSLQSSFSAVIGATAAAAAIQGDVRPGRAQNVETKKTSSPDSGKKSAASSNTDSATAAPVAQESIPTGAAVPVVLQVVIPQLVTAQAAASEAAPSQSAVSALTTALHESGPSLQQSVVAKNATSELIPTAPQAIATADSKGLADVTRYPDAASVEQKTSAVGDAKSVASVSDAESKSVAKIELPAVPVAAAAVPTPGVVPVEQASVTAAPVNALKDVSPVRDIASAVSAAAKSAVADAVSTNVAAPVRASIGQTSSDVVTPAIKAMAPVDVKPAAQGAAPSGVPAVPAVTKTSVAAVNVPQAQGSSAVNVPAAVANSQAHVATPVQAGTNAASGKVQPDTTAIPATAQPVDAPVVTATQQITAVAVPQSQGVPLQSVDTTAAPLKVDSFKAPIGKSGMTGAANQVAGVSKGRASSSDVKTSRIAEDDDDKSSSTGADSAMAVTRVAGSDAVSKPAEGNIKGAVESAVLVQNAQSAQTAGQTGNVPAPTSSAPAAQTQSVNTTTGSNLPAAVNSPDSAQASHALNSAQLIQSVHGSEMRLGMQSAEFGNISINTSLSHQVLSAQISMEHSALGHALAAHLPAIEEKLGSAYGLQAKVELRDSGSHAAANDSSSSGESRGDRRSQGGSTGTSTTVPQGAIGALTGTSFAPSSTSMAATTSSRLDIRI